MKGFVLQPTYKLEGGRPVVLIYGKLQDGASFLVRDSRARAYFYIRLSDAPRAAALGARLVEETPPRRTMAGEPVVRVELERPQQAPELRDRLVAQGVPCFEADIRFAYRYLIDRGIRASLEIEGPCVPGDGVDRIFTDPEIRPAAWSPALRVLSLDIETDPQVRRLLSVALVGCGAREVLLLAGEGRSCPPGAVACAGEREILRRLMERVRQLDPDVITGWNLVDFDLAVLDGFARRYGLTLALGRGPEPMRLRRARSRYVPSEAWIPGRVVLDGIHLLRTTYVRLESYALDAAAREILGKRKTIRGPNRAEEILRLFHEDLPGFVAYNLRDAELVLEILDKLHLVELAVERSRLTGLPLERTGASVAAFDFLYLSELHKRRIVAPTAALEEPPGEPTLGGHVLEPRPGLCRHVIVLDFKSLYPSIIRTFNIDPLGRLAEDAPREGAIVAPNGAAFRRDPGILPSLLDELFPRREAALRSGDRVAAQAIKILMNSFYGVLGTPACRFASPALANAITSFGREILRWTKRRIERRGLRVLYGDTDSLFVLSGEDDPAAARRLGERLAAELTQELARHVRARWGVASRLELEFEKLYVKLLLPHLRRGKAGARKRYAGYVEGGGVEFTGLEVVRRDWTPLARRVQRELYERLFQDRPVEDYLRQVVADLRAGKLDQELVYRKALRKPLEAYTASTPPHVAAARKMQGEPGGLVHYTMTTRGPEPAEERRAPLDYEHYVQKQIRPVAEPVLELLGLDFERVIGEAHQARLF